MELFLTLIFFLLFQLPSLGTFNEQVGQFCKAINRLRAENSMADASQTLMHGHLQLCTYYHLLDLS